MDLELTDEQTMLGEALTTLLEREWLPAETAHTATPEQRARLWSAIQEFFDAELGAVELCLAARLLGAHLASTPFVGSAALRYIGIAHEERVAIVLPGMPVEHAAEVDRFAVVGDGTLSLVPAAGATIEAVASLDAGTPLFTVTALGGEPHEV